NVSVSAVNVNADSSTMPAPAGPPTSVMNDDSTTPVIDNVLSENNSDINQTAQRGRNVPRAESKFKGEPVS
ncbi:hypothetical protein H0H87_002622, partial [Tephrocybe sp. NHM501043]